MKMAPNTRMESFKELKVHLKTIGLRRANSSLKERNSCIIKNCVVFFALASFFASAGWFRIFSAQSVLESTESSFFALIAMLCIAWHSTLFWLWEKYAALSYALDAEIEQSE